MNSRRLLPLLAALAVSAAPGRPARADGVEWRKDYASALHEARAKGLPLVLDFGNDDCVWCDKLDAVTFRAPTVIALLNGRFIPLRVHAARYPELVRHLNIQSYPTLVVADPSGKILRAHVGFLEPGPFLAFLRRAAEPDATAAAPPAPAAPAAARVPARVADGYERAGRAIARSEYARAVALLKAILKEDAKDPVRAKAARLLEQLEDQAAARLKRVKELEEAGQVTEAVQAARELARLFDGTAAAAEGVAMLSSLTPRLDAEARERLQQVHELLLQAQEDFRTRQYLICLIRCETVATRFGDLAESTEAAQLVEKITGNPEWMQQVCDTLPDLGGMSFLKMAEAKLKQGQPQQAVFFLERILQAFPNTRHAELAQVRLSQIQGPPAVPTSDEKKQ
jgi:thioredoxin-related protein